MESSQHEEGREVAHAEKNPSYETVPKIFHENLCDPKNEAQVIESCILGLKLEIDNLYDFWNKVFDK